MFLSRRVLRLETDETDAGTELYTISNLGGVLWDLVGCNALTWVLLFLCMFRGVKSRSGLIFAFFVQTDFSQNKKMIARKVGK